MSALHTLYELERAFESGNVFNFGAAAHTFQVMVFNGVTGANEIHLTDNLADALSIKIIGGNDFLVFDTRNGAEKLTVMSDPTQKLGFYGTTPVVQQSALTAILTTITHTAPGTPDYAIQDLTQTTPWGFASHDEGNSVLKVIANLQVKVAELEAAMEAFGFVAAN